MAKKKATAKRPKSHSNPPKAKAQRRARPSPVQRHVQFSEEVRESIAGVKSMFEAQQVVERKPVLQLDRVYLQGIKFEVASIRQVLERVSRQIDSLERKIDEL